VGAAGAISVLLRRTIRQDANIAAACRSGILSIMLTASQGRIDAQQRALAERLMGKLAAREAQIAAREAQAARVRG
jgi:hypothetical protein